MKKRITSAIFALIFIVTFGVHINANFLNTAQTEDQCLENYSNINTLSHLSNVAITSSSADILESMNFYTLPADESIVQRLFDAPDDILVAPTGELLEYFMNSLFICDQIMAPALMSVQYDIPDVDYVQNKAFKELISRSDFLNCLESYAEALPANCSMKGVSAEGAALAKMLEQPDVKRILLENGVQRDCFDALRYFCERIEAETEAAGDYVGSINNIPYYSAGTISTVNDRSVEVCVPGLALTQSEITEFNNTIENMFEGEDCERISSPDAKYNCHSYAWYMYSSANPYWIMSISEYILDSACQSVNYSSLCEDDIVVYCDDSGRVLHSGIVTDVGDEISDISVCSKWGQAGAYMHNITSVPSGYCASNNSVRVLFFRYHDYSRQYMGDEYHQGIRHFYLYADVCEICGNQTDEVWESVPCSGPPCPVIYRLSDENRTNDFIIPDNYNTKGNVLK